MKKKRPSAGSLVAAINKSAKSTDSVSARPLTEPRAVLFRLTWSYGVDDKSRAEYYETMPEYSTRISELTHACGMLGIRFGYVVDELEYVVKQSMGGESFVGAPK